jgi:pyruvate/2-oxoglutarate/acetoin dehydrogenase E1 component
MTYLDELSRAMEELGRWPWTIFMGQAVGCPGTGMTQTFKNVARDKLLELPVTEDMQLGMATGMSLAGYMPICVYPRINFMMLAMGQLVLHLDALPRYSRYKPRVIIRTAVATAVPLDPGHQHLGDYSGALRDMLETVKVVNLTEVGQVFGAYMEATEAPRSTLIVEYVSLYQMRECDPVSRLPEWVGHQ